MLTFKKEYLFFLRLPSIHLEGWRRRQKKYTLLNVLVLSSYILHRIVKDLLKNFSTNIKTKAVRRFDDNIIIINGKWLFLRAGLNINK